MKKEKEWFEVKREAGINEDVDSLTEPDREGLSQKKKRGEEWAGFIKFIIDEFYNTLLWGYNIYSLYYNSIIVFLTEFDC